MKTYKILSSTIVSQEQVDDVLVAAFEGGITYWCAEIRESKPPSEQSTYYSNTLTRDGELELYVIDERKWYKLTLDKLLEAFGDMEFDFDDYDAGNADAAIQIAVFGEVVYG